MPEYKLTTFDNPYSPFDEFDAWYHFDEIEKGYGSVEYLARIIEMFDDYDEDFAEQVAINEICKHNVRGIWTKITKEQADKLIEQRNNK